MNDLNDEYKGLQKQVLIYWEELKEKFKNQTSIFLLASDSDLKKISEWMEDYNYQLKEKFNIRINIFSYDKTKNSFSINDKIKLDPDYNENISFK